MLLPPYQEFRQASTTNLGWSDPKLLPLKSESFFPFLITAVRVTEAIVILLSAAVSKDIYLNFSPTPENSTFNYLGPGIVVAIFAQFTFYRLHLYKKKIADYRYQYVGHIFLALGLAFLLTLALVSALSARADYHYDWFFIWFLVSFLILIAGRAALNMCLRFLHVEKSPAKKVAIFGSGELPSRVTEYLQKRFPNVEIIGPFNDFVPDSLADNANQLGELETVIELGKRNLYDCVIVAMPHSSYERIRATVRELSVLPVPVGICFEFLDLSSQIRYSDKAGDLQLLQLQSHPLSESDTLIKSIMDYVLSASALLLLAPLFLIISICIKLEGPGSVFFVQRRHGYNHNVIRVFKFRTMTVLEDGEVIAQAKPGDKRVTKVGRFLRNTSLDELPQLFNVLKGEMSLVGPRPHALAHNKMYEGIIEQYAARHRVKPGLTGLAQVNGCRGETNIPGLMERRVAYDLEYINNYTVALDIRIFFRTIFSILGNNKAY